MTTFQTSAVTVLLCYFTHLHESDLKLRFLHLLCTNVLNMTKVVIKILQGNAVTQTVYGGLLVHLLLAIFVGLPKIMKLG